MNGPENATPPAIRKSVRVGVTGHRDLTRAEVPGIEAQVRQILKRIRLLVETAEPPSRINGLFHEQDPFLQVISPLAAGADQIVAQEALLQGYTLCAMLPFPGDEYRNDFDKDPPARQHFDALLNQAESVLELDGQRDTRHSAYEAVGRMVLESSDILLAIWDGQPAHGRGGTGQIVAEAIKSQVIVVIIPRADPARAVIHISGQHGVVTLLDLGDLESALAGVIFPGWQLQPGDQDARQQLNAYIDFAAETPLPQRRTRRLLISRIWIGNWKLFRRTFMAFCNKPATEWEEPQRVDLPGVNATEARGHYDAHYRWASKLARYYASLYRASFLMNYLLAASAVTLILLAHTVPAIELLFLVLELVCIGMIVTVYVIAQKKRWHGRYVDYRILAEQLRLMRSLALLSLTVPATRPPVHSAKQGDLTGSWVNWHFRAVLRDVAMLRVSYGPPQRSACVDVLIKEIVRPQLDYHVRARREARCGQRFCRRLIAGLFTLTAVACALHIVPLLGDVRVSTEALHTAIPWLTVVAACLPAWAAAFHGASSQAEFERLGNRSESMALHLDGLAGRLENMIAGQQMPELTEIRAAGRFLAEVMLSEVLDWRVFYMAGEIPTT